MAKRKGFQKKQPKTQAELSEQRERRKLRIEAKVAQKKEEATAARTILGFGNKLKKNKVRVIDGIFAGELTTRDFPSSSGLDMLSTIVEANKDDIVFLDVFKALITQIVKVNANRLLDDKKAVGALRNIAENHNLWIRDIANWKKNSYNIHKQFSDLLRFLFVTYDVPEFMDTAWYSEDKRYMSWFLHIGNGSNIRTAYNMPINMTKKMAHEFMKAPNYYSVTEALRYAQIKGWGGDERLVRAIVETPLSRNFENEDFWSTVIHFFVRNPMLDTEHISPIIDYIKDKKFEVRRVFVERGRYREEPPEQPAFSMKGRTVMSLLRDVNVWHRHLNRVTGRAGAKEWTPVEINDFIFKTGDDTSKNRKSYRITQLLTAKELAMEGKAMRHCVPSYSHSCSRGQTSIWSLSVEDKLGLIDKLVTIEVSKDKRITQIRGRMNRLPTAQEMNFIQRWATVEGLEISKWIRPY